MTRNTDSTDSKRSEETGLTYWRRSSRWRNAKRKAIKAEDWKHAAMIECIALRINPFDATIQRILLADSLRFSTRILNYLLRA